MKAEHRVELDRVRGDAALAVFEVEEANAADRRRPAEEPEEARRRDSAGSDDARPGPRHHPPHRRRCPTRAGRGRRLGDHRPARRGVGDDQVNVLVVLELHREQANADAVDRRLDTAQAPAVARGRPKPAKRCDRRVASTEVDEACVPVGQRLHCPALDAADAEGRRTCEFAVGADGRERENCSRGGQREQTDRRAPSQAPMANECAPDNQRSYADADSEDSLSTKVSIQEFPMASSTRAITAGARKYRPELKPAVSATPPATIGSIAPS